MGLQAKAEPKKGRYFVYIEDRNEITATAGRGPLKSKKSTTEYMLAVYNSASADFRHNEEFGDRRVNLYITLATAVLGGLILLVTRQVIESLLFLLPAVAFGIAVVLSIGWPTFLRILTRNKATDQYIRSMRDVGKFFILSEPSIKPFLNEFDPFKPKDRRSKTLKLYSPATGGYLQTVAILNSLVAASLPLLVILALNTVTGAQDGSPTRVDLRGYIFLGFSAALLALGSWWFQIKWAERVYEKDEEKWAEKKVEKRPRK